MAHFSDEKSAPLLASPHERGGIKTPLTPLNRGELFICAICVHRWLNFGSLYLTNRDAGFRIANICFSGA